MATTRKSKGARPRSCAEAASRRASVSELRGQLEDSRYYNSHLHNRLSELQSTATRRTLAIQNTAKFLRAMADMLETSTIPVSGLPGEDEVPF